MGRPAVLLLVVALLPCAAAGATGAPERGAKAGGAAEDPWAAQRTAMVELQIRARGVASPEVLAAMLRVPRHLFVPEDERRSSYDDRPLPIGYGQTISQPYIVAFMTELLALRSGDRVLEIGTGSGYQAAVLAELTPWVFSMEIVPELASRARRTLDEAGYGAVKLRSGDGYYGWEDEAPFDAIIVTAAADHVPPPLIAQLRSGGRMVIPIGAPWEVQALVFLTKDENGKVESRRTMAVRFVPFTGRAARE